MIHKHRVVGGSAPGTVASRVARVPMPLPLAERRQRHVPGPSPRGIVPTPAGAAYTRREIRQRLVLLENLGRPRLAPEDERWFFRIYAYALHATDKSMLNRIGRMARKRLPKELSDLRQIMVKHPAACLPPEQERLALRVYRFARITGNTDALKLVSNFIGKPGKGEARKAQSVLALHASALGDLSGNDELFLLEMRRKAIVADQDGLATQAGRFFNEIAVRATDWFEKFSQTALGTAAVMTREQEKEVMRLYRVAHAAQNERLIETIEMFMMKKNMGLVYKILGKRSRQGHLAEAGKAGIVTAVRRFDYTKTNRFATYAVRWIRQTIRRRSLSQARTIRLPDKAFDDLMRLEKGIWVFEGKHGRTPSPEEIREMTGFTLKYTRTLLLHMGQDSLDRPIGHDTQTTRLDLIDRRTVDPHDPFANVELRAVIGPFLEALAPDDRLMLGARFSLVGYSPDLDGQIRQVWGVRKTPESLREGDVRHESIAQVLGISRETVQKRTKTILARLHLYLLKEGYHGASP